jgi:hypothetical protein
MGQYVEIKKIREISGDYYYSVTSPDYPHVPMFYIGINPTEKRVRLYKDLINKQLECEILVEQYESDQLPVWIPGFLLYATLKKVRQAIEDDQFSDYISFQS